MPAESHCCYARCYCQQGCPDELCGMAAQRGSIIKQQWQFKLKVLGSTLVLTLFQSVGKSLICMISLTNSLLELKINQISRYPLFNGTPFC